MGTAAMSLPTYPRVVYAKNPIRSVICQLRFPAILRIDEGPPAAFQELIRHEYPIYEERDTTIPTDLPEPFRKLVESSSRRDRRFISEDGQWMISLARDFLAVSTEHYLRWEEFSEHLDQATRALEQVFQPSFYSRVGLRYQNRIKRSEIGLTDIAWNDLLQPHIAGALTTAISPRVEDSRQVILVSLDTGKVRVRHGLEQDDSEVVYVIDEDLFAEGKTEVTNVAELVRNFNQHARNTFRWCITERLHAALDPQDVPTG